MPKCKQCGSFESGYSDEELQAFAEKDLRIVRQNALSHAVEMVKMKGGPFDINEVFDHANACVTFVYDGMRFPCPTVSTTVNPTTGTTSGTAGTAINAGDASNEPSASKAVPNPVLQAVTDKLGASSINVDYNKLEVQVKKLFGGLPTSMNSVDKIIDSIDTSSL